MKSITSLFCGAFLVLTLTQGGLGQETERVYLSGRDKDHTVDWEFCCTTGAKSGEWTTLPVPSQWDVLGFGMLNYKKDIESALEEHGLYRHTFDAPAEWQGKRVILVFEGVMTDTSVKVNGQSAGPTHQGGYYRFKYDITNLLKLGQSNLLEVDVAKHSANESVNKAERTADFWVFGGVYRPVYLEVVPLQYIDRVAINAQANGDFTADVYLSGTGTADAVEGQIKSLEGEPAGAKMAASLADEKVHLQGHVDSPRCWSAETPNLYELELTLKQREQVLHRLHQRFGFRTIEVRPNDGIYVNGQRVILKGVNRHSTWPDSGRCLSEAVHRLDIETIQAMNMNAVRMSHYPPDQEFLDLCDELGLYVLDELAGWHWHYDTDLGRHLVHEMVTRDVNHPSILFWDNGNEGGFNKNLDEVFGQFDPQRRTVLHPWEAFNHVNTAHYLEYDRVHAASLGAPTRHGTGEVYQEWEEQDNPEKFIYMPTEMLHGLYHGGSGAGLADYWHLMQESPVLGGAFLWVLFDEGIKRPDGTMDCAGNQAPDGIVGPYREREASFYTIQQLWSPIQITRTDNGFTVKNEYSFTDASQCRYFWKLLYYGPAGANATVVREGEGTLPAIPPGESGTLPLELPELGQPVDALSLRVEDPHGRELWTWVWPLSDLPPQRFIAPQQSAGVPQAVESDSAVTLLCGNLSITIDKHTGMLGQATNAGQTFSLSRGPVATAGQSQLASLKTDQDGKTASVVLAYSGALESVTWTLHDSGWLDCQYSYRAEGPLSHYGVTFDYPAELVTGKRWLGDGPYRVWKNRRQGVTLGVWENAVNNTITGYSEWKYPEFAGCFANVRWLQLQTKEGPITVVPHDSKDFVQVLSPQFPPVELQGETKVSLPECGLALLDAIPPVGSKFKKADTTGPQGQPNVAQGRYTGKVSFFFGELSK